MELRLETVARNGVAILRCHGRLAYGEATAELDHAVRVLFDSSKQIVLQLANVSMMDSGGVGTLGALFMAAHNRGAEIKLAALSPRVEEVLRVTGLSVLLDTYDDEQEAVEAFLHPHPQPTVATA
jgi:anti-sigma B factor antagonist